MRKLLYIPLLALAVMTANAADQRKPGFYLRGDAFGVLGHEPITGKALVVAGFSGLGIGYRFNETFRAELNGAARGIKVTVLGKDVLQLYQIGGVANGFIDFNTSTAFTPYVTAGVGYANIHLIIGSKNAQSILNMFPTSFTQGFIWNIGAGSRVQLSKNVDLDVGYRFVNDLWKFKPHEATLGIVAHF